MTDSESWRRAARHPVRSAVISFVSAAVGVGAILYFGPGDDSLTASILVGIACGLMVTILSVREMRQQPTRAGLPTLAKPTLAKPTLRRMSLFDLILSAAGAALLIWAAAERSSDLVVAALWFLGLAAVLIAARWLLRRRG